MSDSTKTRLCLAAALAALAAGVTLAGCSDEADAISSYPYFIETLNERWAIVRESFASDTPNLNFAPVLLKDVAGTLGAMERTYSGPNRDEAVKRLTELNTQLQADLRGELLIRGGPVALRPGATVADVKATLEKAYKSYTEFLQLVES